ncbi:MAG: hypothetical protein ABI182_05765 [Candidatus Baltobacteraceae bacterium]
MSALSYPVTQGVDASAQLRYLRQVFGLSNIELGKLFGVERQAVAQWEKRGVPPSRSASVDRLVEFAQFLQRRLISARIPQIVRTPAKGLANNTMLGVLQSHGVEPLYEYFASLSAYAPL